MWLRHTCDALSILAVVQSVHWRVDEGEKQRRSQSTVPTMLEDIGAVDVANL